MKISRIVLAVLFALAVSANTLRAVPLPTFAFMRTAKASSSFLLSLAAASFPYLACLCPIPDPAGRRVLWPLRHTLSCAPFPEGDVVLMDANGQVSDILRFDPATILFMGPSYLLLF